jgi:hypothetical protein
MLFYLFDAQQKRLMPIKPMEIILVTPEYLIYRNKYGGFRLNIDEFWYSVISSLYGEVN